MVQQRAKEDAAPLVPVISKELSVEPRRDEEHHHPAAGFPAVFNVMKYAHETSGLVRGTRALLRLNQVEGFDCPSCAWPDPHANHRAKAEFCENGGRAAVHEADRRRADAAFFAQHSIAELLKESDYELEQHGRLCEPLIKRPGGTHYEPISYADAYAIAGAELKKLTPNECVFYTSGRASNEAAFVYQLFARVLGTNNLPDCSNMCHESSGVGLGQSVGVGKGSVQLDDFALADMIILIGQNPGTNHPRMLSTLAEARERGCAIVGVNPIRERGLMSFAHPQTVDGMVGLGKKIASHFAQVKIGGDVALLKGMMKDVFALDDARGDVLDRDFIAEHTTGFEALRADVEAATWDDLVEESGVSREAIRALAELYAVSKRVIVCWAMGITQHKNSVDNVKAIVNLLLLRGNIGRPGAGVCPVRGHSNVQGDRTMGIYERPTEAFLKRLDAATGISSPREHGVDAVAAVHAFETGHAKAFMALGGNYTRAMSDSDRTAAAVARCKITIHVATKLNRTHLEVGETSLLLPCLGRSEVDERKSGPQFVTVEDSMSVVHRSQGRLAPVDPGLQSETAIVCGIADATVGSTKIDFPKLADDYNRIRDLVEKSIAGFESYNDRVRTPDGFVLENGAAKRHWATGSGKAEFNVTPLVGRKLEPGQLVLMTIRSHDQFNTTIYALNDRYREIHRRRDVLLLNQDDMTMLGLAAEEPVAITSHFEGERRTLAGFKAYPYDLPRGSCAAYYPETNPLVPLDSFADGNRTPTSKSVVVTIAKSSA